MIGYSSVWRINWRAIRKVYDRWEIVQAGLETAYYIWPNTYRSELLPIRTPFDLHLFQRNLNTWPDAPKMETSHPPLNELSRPRSAED
jgi:hypothetical protein